IPSSPAVRMMTRADSAPARWPSMRGRWRCRAQRPLPSMMIATWRGNDALASGLRWAAWVLTVCGVQITRWGREVNLAIDISGWPSPVTIDAYRAFALALGQWQAIAKSNPGARQ